MMPRFNGSVPKPGSIGDTILQVLKQRGPTTASSLSTCIGRSPATVSSILNKLWKKGFLAKLANLGSRGGNGYCLIEQIKVW